MMAGYLFAFSEAAGGAYTPALGDDLAVTDVAPTPAVPPSPSPPIVGVPLPPSILNRIPAWGWAVGAAGVLAGIYFLGSAAGRASDVDTWLE
ncbi:MAG: hypothetical protein ACREM3_15195 [Candidatus Rokuibacteriota bacterium]